jgi:hypothetical protein
MAFIAHSDSVCQPAVTRMEINPSRDLGVACTAQMAAPDRLTAVNF